MAYLFIGSVSAACLSLYIAWRFFQANAALKKQIEELEKERRALGMALKDRNKTIEELQEAYHAAERKKKSLRSGDPDADFRRSLDLLRDVPGEDDTD